MSFFINLVSFIFSLPILVFVLVYIVNLLWSKDKKESILLAIYITGISLIFSVAILINNIWITKYGFLFLLIGMLISYLVLLLLQYLLKSQLDLQKIIRPAYLLFCFIIFIIYCILIVLNISKAF